MEASAGSGVLQREEETHGLWRSGLGLGNLGETDSPRTPERRGLGRPLKQGATLEGWRKHGRTVQARSPL